MGKIEIYSYSVAPSYLQDIWTSSMGEDGGWSVVYRRGDEEVAAKLALALGNNYRTISLCNILGPDYYVLIVT